MKLEILSKLLITNLKTLEAVLLKNRGLKTKKEIDDFLNPKDPQKIKWKELGVKDKLVEKIIERLKIAKKKKEKIVIFGDYDADGVCATAIIWEALYKLGYDVMPYIPNRFNEGYGFKDKTFKNPKFQILNANLIITVDNGIVAYDGIKEAKKMGIDVIVIDHHRKEDQKLNTDYVIHSTIVCGSVLAWFLSCELCRRFRTCKKISESYSLGLDLAVIGTIADQMPLLGVNRSIVKFGLEELKKTKRVGLKELVKQSKIITIGTYEIGFVLAPRINAMGRLSDAIDSLRLLCTKNTEKAIALAEILNRTNQKRQKIVEEILEKALKEINEKQKIIVIHGDYHEGIIGLISSKVTEKLYKPSIIISKGEKISKASARSIPGFDIVRTVKETELILEGGGHSMAAGFSIETKKIKLFTEKINKISKKYLTEDILQKKLKIDAVINFEIINKELIDLLRKFEPTGYGNYSPIFLTKGVEIKEMKVVGNDGKHLKLKLKQNETTLDAIWFGFTNNQQPTTNNQQPKINDLVDCVYIVDENTWNSKTKIQLKIKDIRAII